MVGIFKSGAMIFSYPYFSKSVGIGSKQFETVCKMFQPFETCICGAKTNQAPMVHSGKISYSTTRSKSGIRGGTQNKNNNITKYPSQFSVKNGQIWFSEAWKNECQLNKKLKFYCSLKENLRFEPYIKNAHIKRLRQSQG